MTRLFAVALLGLALALAALSAQAQSLSASPLSLYSGQSSTASWSGIATPTPKDWIGLYTPGSADGAFISWRYTDGSAAGSVPFLIPVGTAAGTYELRLYANDGFTLLATSTSFTVAGRTSLHLARRTGSVSIYRVQRTRTSSPGATPMARLRGMFST